MIKTLYKNYRNLLAEQDIMEQSNPAEELSGGSLLNKAARLISTIFVPPSLTIIIFTFFALYLEKDFVSSAVVLSVAYTFGFVFQIIMFFYFRRKGRIADQDASIRRERTIPMLTAVLFYIAGLIVLAAAGINMTITAFWSCYITNTLTAVLINRYWKISAHAGGIAGPLAALTFVSGIKAFPFFVLLPLVGWARIRLKQHSWMQVAAGGILGFIITYFQILLIVMAAGKV